MALKFGRKNEINLDPLSYNLMLIGEGGIGKTTIIKEYCEKLVDNEDGYIFLETGKEDGEDALNGLNFVACVDWDSEYNTDNPQRPTIGFHTFVEDVVENRTTDWKDLRVVVVDTIDQLFDIAEPEVIRMHNRENPKKRTKSIKGAFGGFQGGEKMAIKIVLDDLWALKNVGVSFICIGHTKQRNKTDVATGEEYAQLSTDMDSKYFEAIKNKVHFLGTCFVDREIVRECTGKKNIVTGEEIKKGVIKSETRKITFRDDNHSIDSKSRFADIIDSIPFDSDALIAAITDAIKTEQAKSGVSLDDAKKRQDTDAKKKMERVAAKEKETKAQKELDSIIGDIVEWVTENKDNIAKVKPILETCKTHYGTSNPKEITDIEIAKEILALTLK